MSVGTPTHLNDKKWTHLAHQGVLFPPKYKPHHVKMLYDGVPVTLTPEQEEVATMYAIMLETDYMQKKTFKKNFWADWKAVLGPNHTIQNLDKCDFRPIVHHLMADREEKRAMSKEEKKAIKDEKDLQEAAFKFATVDGRREQVGNFRVEPPGLFRGRGEHPKMGMLKRRIYPEDVTLNLSKDAPVPPCPIPGRKWGGVIHQQDATWLAAWKDPVNQKSVKYVSLAANSLFKHQSDLHKYEKARKLKDCIDQIRGDYKKGWLSTDRQRQQISVATYFIDKLALRAGHEKDQNEAGMVDFFSLRVENIDCLEGNQLKFNFLGKDSVRYENTVTVDPKEHELVSLFRMEGLKSDGRPFKKQTDDDLFDQFDASDLNTYLKKFMDGLSAKVFRTYNASITLDRLLREQEKEAKSVTVEEKKADYDRANKEVAILCNHQRSVPKTHGQQMEKMDAKIKAVNAEIAEMEKELKDLKDVKKEEALRARLGKKCEMQQKMELQKSVKDDLKKVAMETSTIHYTDPRITVAWCKRNEVPINDVFPRSLRPVQEKCGWAMDVELEFRF